MKFLFKGQPIVMESLGFYLLLAIVAFIPFDITFGNLALIGACVYNVAKIKTLKFSYNKFLAIAFPVLFFIITVVSSLFSKAQYEGLKHTDLESLLIVISFILVRQNINKGQRTKIFDCFYWATVVSTLILIANACFRLAHNHNNEEVIFHGFTSLYDQHPVYFSLYLSLALFYSVQKPKSKGLLWIRVTTNTLLVCGIVLCASKAVIVMDILIISIFLMVKKRKSVKSIVAILALLICVVTAAFNIPFLKQRFSEGLKFSDTIKNFQPTNTFNEKKLFSYEEKTNISDLELRYLFGKIALFHIKEDNRIMLGYGQGDTQKYLDYYYFSYNLGPNWYEDFNVHNQYLHIFVTYGAVVLVFFLTYLLYCFYVAIVAKDYLYLGFLLICAFVFCFEVVLVRNKGIVFFYFFNTLFLLTRLNFENSYTGNKRNS